jgi:hypothetical protein
MGERIHPWRRLRALGEAWTLHWHHPDDDDRMGVTRHGAKEISLREDLTWAERRCTALHETLHAERGPANAGVLHEREELAVRKITARLMLPDVRAIGEALAWALSPEECADELMVDAEVLRDRLRYLHPAERHYLTRRLAEM